MEAAAVANSRIQAKYSKERKVGEGTYAVVYLGQCARHIECIRSALTYESKAQVERLLQVVKSLSKR